MIRIANKEAEKSNYLYRLGAVITKGKRVLATGHNQLSYCKLNKWKGSKHAEMDVILKVLRRADGLSLLAGATLYVSRINRTGQPAMAKPCTQCMNLAISVGLKDIFYTTDSQTVRIKL